MELVWESIYQHSYNFVQNAMKKAAVYTAKTTHLASLYNFSLLRLLNR